MKIYRTISKETQHHMVQLLQKIDHVDVPRTHEANSSHPYPKSTDLESILKNVFQEAHFAHHVRLRHPRLKDTFEYDFWRASDGIAIEIMGYRADDEIYKNIFKFHIHKETKIGIVFVPRYKWIGNRQTETNYKATIKALSFAENEFNLDALIAIVYSWEETPKKDTWKLILA